MVPSEWDLSSSSYRAASDLRCDPSIEFETYPVGGHDMHGYVERSIKEIKRVFMNVFRGIKLSILGYEAARSADISFIKSKFSFQELSSDPICKD